MNILNRQGKTRVKLKEKVNFSKQGIINLKTSSQDQALEIVRRRIDEIGTNDREWRETEDAIDSIRSKYGPDSIGVASTLTEKGLNSKKRGIQQWGPESSK